jgi:AraC-like DNA-binding protein
VSLTESLAARPPDGRTRVLRHDAPGNRWQWWLRKPPASLAGVVASIWLWDGESDGFTRHRELPTSEIDLAFTLGPAGRVVEGGGVGPEGRDFRSGWISGLREAPMTVESAGRRTRILALQLRPLGAWALLRGMPLSGIANRVLDVEDVIGSRVGVGTLRQRLLDAPDAGAALDLAEHWLAARAADGPEAHPATRAAMAYLTKHGGGGRVGSLARTLGLSSRRLRTLFHSQVGVSTKRLARILRFERAVQRLATEPADLARVAAECGYYDQAHMNRDFRELGDLTPTAAADSALPMARPDETG